jgi:exonuclease III
VADDRALQAVLPPGWRVACTSRGAGTQHLAFALREPLAARARCTQVPLGDEGAAGASNAGRHALALQLDGRSLLNLHLKAGCSGGPIDGTHRPACATLQRQAQALQAWIDGQANAGRRFVLLGDFNRDLRAERRHPARHDGSDPAAALTDAASVRNLWPELDDGRRRLHWVDTERRAAREAGCLVSLDHLIEGGPEPDREAPTEPTRARLVPAPADASDHCPLLAQLPR